MQCQFSSHLKPKLFWHKAVQFADQLFIYSADDPKGLKGYLLASVMIAIAFGIRLLIAPVEAGLQYVTFFPAVTLSVVIAGFRPGVFATALGVLLATFFFTSPYYSFSLLSWQNSAWSNLIFMIDGMVVCLAVDAMHRYRHQSTLMLNKVIDRSIDFEQSNERLKQIIDNLQIYVTLLDSNARVVEVNKIVTDSANYAFEDAVGKSLFDLPCWNYDEAVRSKLRLALELARQGNSQRYDVIAAINGNRVPVDLQIAAIFNEDDEVDGFLVAGVDISTRKQAEDISLRHKVFIDGAHDGFWVNDLDGNLLEANEAYATMSGYSVDELAHMHISQLEAIEQPDEVRAHIAKILTQGFDVFETRHRHKDGHEFEVEVSVNLNRESQQLFAFFRDITERKRHLSQLRIAAITFESQEGIMITDADGHILRVNQAFQKITGYSADEVIGKTPDILSSGRHDPAFYEEMWGQLLDVGSWSGEIWDRRKNGQIYPKLLTITAVKNDQGAVSEYAAIFRDITERKMAEEAIHNLAFYDELTKLANRRLLLDRLEHALSASARSRQYGAILFLDMDKFKLLNDTLGHNYGDILLVEVANRLKFSVREADSVARIGGDEFVVLLEELSESAAEASQKAAMIAEKIREALAVPYHILNHVHHSSPSIGVRLFCGDDEHVEDLLKHADAAMYEAKNAGRNQVRFFDPSLQHALEIRAAMETDLRAALREGQFRLYFQVQFADDNRAIGAEALIRWMHPQRGMVSPAEFIPLAEDTSLILDIGSWVLNSACRQLAEWQQNARTRSLQLAINVSAHQFRAHNFVESVMRAIEAHDIDASTLKLELTESVILDNVSEVVSKMLALKRLGVKLSLDDFGTGYSSLSYLKQLPLDQLKIDQSFVRDIASNPNDEIMVKTIIDMARNFKLQVIAEGVETEAQLNYLKQHGCMAFQGYLFGRPVPIEEFYY